MRFRAVLFDAGDILFDSGAWRRWLHAELSRRGRGAPAEELFWRWESYHLPLAQVGRIPLLDAVRAFLTERGLSDEELADLAAAAGKAREEIRERREVFPEVTETLARLREAGLRLCVLSDSVLTGAELAAELVRRGIGHYFHAIVTSRDVRACKPSPVAFAAALRAVGALAEESAFVAHDPDEILGARAAGLLVIAFNARDPQGAHAVAPRFSDVARIVLNGETKR